MRKTISVAVFDSNDPITSENVAESLREYRSLVIPCSSQSILLTTIKNRHTDAVVIGFQEPFKETFDLLSQIKAQAVQPEVVFVSEFDDKTLWVWIEAIQRGAYEFLPKSVDLVDVQRVLLRAAERHHPVQMKKLDPAKSIRAQSLKPHQHKAMGVGVNRAQGALPLTVPASSRPPECPRRPCLMQRTGLARTPSSGSRYITRSNSLPFQRQSLQNRSTT